MAKRRSHKGPTGPIGSGSRIVHPDRPIAHGPTGGKPYPLSDARYARRKQQERFEAERIYLQMEYDRVLQEKKIQEMKDALESIRKESNKV